MKRMNINRILHFATNLLGDSSSFILFLNFSTSSLSFAISEKMFLNKTSLSYLFCRVGTRRNLLDHNRSPAIVRCHH